MTECNKYQDMIGALLDGELSQQEQEALRAHLAECPDCRNMHAAFSAVSEAMHAQIELPPADFTQTVMACIAAREARAKKPRPVWHRMLALAACLALIVIGVTPWLPRASTMREDGAAEPAAYDYAVAEAAEAPMESLSRMDDAAPAAPAEPAAPMPEPQEYSAEMESVGGVSDVTMHSALAVDTRWYTTQDPAVIASLQALLAPDDAVQTQAVHQLPAPDCVIVLQDETLQWNIWYTDAGLLCSTGGVPVPVVGTAEALDALLAQCLPADNMS